MKREYIKLPTIAETTLDGGIYITAILDTRHQQEGKKTPIAIRVSCQRALWYYATGVKLPLTDTGDTLKDYEAICSARGSKGRFSPAKMEVIGVFNKVRSVSVNLNKSQRGFSLQALKDELKPKVIDITSAPSLYQIWQNFASTKSLKTAEQYRQSCVSFFKSRGCKTARVMQEDGTKSRRMELQGKALSMKPRDLTASTITNWIDSMTEAGNSAATIAMNLRAMKALLNSMAEDGIINEVPKFKIKAGGKRDEDILPVRDILKIMAYEGEFKAMADWWMIVYLMNGANVRDLSELKYSTSYEYDKTLSFIRHKTHGKSPSKVVIPIIPELRGLLDKYAEPYRPGALVFPNINGSASTEGQRIERVHGFCAWIREGMAEVCKSLSIRPATVNTARHSFASVLAAHGIPIEYIDICMGHSRKEISSFYVNIFFEQRQKINALLLKEPKGIPALNHIHEENNEPNE